MKKVNIQRKQKLEDVRRMQTETGALADPLKIWEASVVAMEAGADGLIFEPCMDFGHITDEFGKDVCLVFSSAHE